MAVTRRLGAGAAPNSVLQPAYEACIAVQSSSSTAADAFELV